MFSAAKMRINFLFFNFNQVKSLNSALNGGFLMVKSASSSKINLS